jgi:hypothetical protein
VPSLQGACDPEDNAEVQVLASTYERGNAKQGRLQEGDCTGLDLKDRSQPYGAGQSNPVPMIRKMATMKIRGVQKPFFFNCRKGSSLLMKRVRC